MQIPFVCVAFDFMSTEMLDTFPFSLAGAWWWDTIRLKNQASFNDIYVFVFTSISTIVLFCSASSIHFPVHWGVCEVTLEGKRTTQQSENDSNLIEITTITACLRFSNINKKRSVTLLLKSKPRLDRLNKHVSILLVILCFQQLCRCQQIQCNFS